MEDENLPADTQDPNPEVQSEDQDLDPVGMLVDAFMCGDANTAIVFADMFEGRLAERPDDNPDLLPLRLLVRGISLWAHGLLNGLNFDHGAAGVSFRDLNALLANESDEVLETEGFAVFFKVLHVFAKLGQPMSASNEAALVASTGLANREFNRARPAAAEVMALAIDPQEDEWLRAVAANLLNGYFFQGALLHMQNATRGENLRPAQRFFEDMGAQINVLNHSLDMEPEQRQLLDALGYVALSAEKRVKAEVEIQNKNYDAAMDLFDDIGDLFDRASVELPTIKEPAAIAMQFNRMRDVFWNLSGSFHKAKEGLIRLKELEDDLSRALAANENARLLQKEKDAENSRLLEKLATRGLHLNLNNKSVNIVENEIINQIDIRTEISHTVNDWAADQMLAILDQLPGSDAVEKAKKDAAEAKSEDDLGKKLGKVASVIENSGKLIDAAAGVVPYGKPILLALKALYAGFSALRADDDIATGDDPTTVA